MSSSLPPLELSQLNIANSLRLKKIREFIALVSAIASRVRRPLAGRILIVMSAHERRGSRRRHAVRRHHSTFEEIWRENWISYTWTFPCLVFKRLGGTRRKSCNYLVRKDGIINNRPWISSVKRPGLDQKDSTRISFLHRLGTLGECRPSWRGGDTIKNLETLWADVTQRWKDSESAYFGKIKKRPFSLALCSPINVFHVVDWRDVRSLPNYKGRHLLRRC